ncbi:MAG: DUF4855 domain-containing protein [Clostridia bacterium]|nr:DUF4855 domain-containing protein [Clostridia bacterium]
MKRFVRLLSLFLAVLFLVCSCTTPSDESSKSDEGSGDVDVSYDPENANRTLISVGKPYESVVPASSDYADYNGQQLTDGHKTPNTQVHYTDPRMVGYTSDGQFILDLGEDGKRITEIALRAFEFYSDGVKLPTHVRYSGSNDGENWEGIDTAYFIPQGDRSVCVAKVVLDKPTDYRYIKIRVYKGAAFFFIDEIEVYADVPANKNVSLLEAYKNENIDKSAWKALSTSKKAEFSVSANIAYAKQYAYEDCSFDNRAPAEGDARNEKLQTFLTDGKPTGRFFGEDYWVGFTGKDGASPKITVNLGESYDNVYGFRVHAMGVGPDVVYPDYIDVYGSKDAKDYVLLGRVYAPAGGTHFAYTLILKEFVNVKSVRFEFGGNGNFWVEEIEVLAGYSETVLNEMFPPLNLPTVTEDEFWSASEADYTKYQNLLKGVKMHVAAAHYADILTYGKNTAPATNTALTDGKRAVTTDRGTGEYFYMQGGMGYNFFFDMGKVASVDKLVLSFLEYGDWAINRPKFCDVFLSDDGVNWYKVGTRNAAEEGETRNNYHAGYEFVLDKTYSARFVRLRVEANGWLYLEEMEAFGTKAVTGKTVRLADSGMDSVIFYSNYENAQYATTENTPIKAEDINLVYISKNDAENPKKDMLLPYVAYLDKDGNIKDTFMDGFAYLPASPLPSGAAPHEVPVMSDWEWLFETTFHGVYGFDVLEETVQTVKDALGEDYKDYKVQVYVSILTISNATDNFGDVDGDGVPETTKTAEDREKILRWYIGKCQKEFADCGYENLELGGFYWMNEAVIWEKDDSHIIAEVADIVHDMGSYFMWIPYYTANRYFLGYEMGFDFVNMQPNVVFDLDSPLWRFDSTAMLTKYNKMSVEIEHTRQAMSDIAFARNYMLYLYYGEVYGYIDSIHVYYNDRDNISAMGFSDDPLCRLQYDATYHFAKGTLDVTPDTKEKAVFDAAANDMFTANLNPEKDYLLFTLASMPEHGTVSLLSDGTFAYYPDKDFSGTDTFTYTYNNLLGESEECTVEIRVAK